MTTKKNKLKDIKKTNGEFWTLYNCDSIDHVDEIVDSENQRIVVITDPPYSKVTHKGYKNSKQETDCIAYDHFNEDKNLWHTQIIKKAIWVLIFGDYFTWSYHRSEAIKNNRFTFAPVIYARENSAPRFIGDGPTNSCEYISVSRLKLNNMYKENLGSKCGHYIAKTVTTKTLITGQKDLNVIRKIIRDYTTKKDLIVDLYAGSGTTLLAASIEERKSIGFEVREEMFEIASNRLRMGYTALLGI